MTLGDKQQRFAHLLATFILSLYEIEGNEVRVTFGQVFRTPEQQEIYIKQGKSKTKNSQHLVRLAADLNIFIDGKYITGSTEDEKAYLMILGVKWEELCLYAGLTPEWGGRFGVQSKEYATTVGWDSNHFGIK